MKPSARINAIFGSSGTRRNDAGRAATPSISSGPKGSGAPAPRLALLALVIAAFLALTAAPALAARPYESQITEANGAPFSNPWGLAVDASDNLWVGNTGAGGLIDKFDSSGNFKIQGTGEGHWSGSYTQSIAFSNASDHLYVADSDADNLWVLNSDGTYNSDIKGPWGSGCCFIFTAADNSGGGETGGDLYVSSSGGTVTRIDGAGIAAPFTAGAGAGTSTLTGAETPAGSFAAPQSLAVDSSGDLYVVDSGHRVVDEFHSDGSFDQQFSETAPGTPFGSVSAVAVDPTNGNVLIADPANHQVDEFTSSGEFLEAITEANGAALGNPQGLAVDSTSQLYVSDGSNHLIDVFGAPGPPLPKFALEVEKTGSGQGTVTSKPGGISCGTTCTHEFNEGKTVTLTASPGLTSEFTGWTGCTAEPSATECEVEMTAAKSVEAEFTAIPQQTLKVERSGTGEGTVTGTAPAGFTSIECGATCEAQYNQGATITLTASPGLTSEFTGWTGCTAEPSATECEVEMTAAKSVEAEFTAIPQQTLKVERSGTGEGTVTGTAPAGFTSIECGATCEAQYNQGATITLTATAENPTNRFTGWTGCETESGPGNDECTVTMGGPRTVSASFEPLPAAITGEATEIVKTSATLGGTVNPDGVELTECAFEYGKAEEPYEHTATCAESPAQIGSGSEPKEVHAEVSGLEVGAAYHFRLLTANANGTGAGGDQAFITAPSVAGLYTAAATILRPSSATLNGQLDPAGEDTHYRFEYVTEEAFNSTGFASAASTPEEDAGSANAVAFLSAHLSGLTEGSAYRFRLVASNGLGTTHGAAQAFTPGSPLIERTFSSFGAGQLSSPAYVAVDNSSGPSAGDVYVTDPPNHRVEKFDSSGDFILMFGKHVDQTTGASVCTAASGDTCGPGGQGSSPGALSSPTFITVDGSSGPSAGNVYVADPADNLISKFAPDGALIETWGTSGQLDGSTDSNGHGPFGSIVGIAVDPNGNLFVYNESAEMFEFGQDGSFTFDFNTTTGVSPGLAVNSADDVYAVNGSSEVFEMTPLGGVIGKVTAESIRASAITTDPFDNNIYVADRGNVIDHYSDIYVADRGNVIDYSNSCFSKPQGCTPADSFGSGHLSGAEGLAVDSASAAVYAADTGDRRVGLFAPLLSVPTDHTSASINDTATTATLLGVVSTGGARTTYHFEYVTDEAFQQNGFSTATSTPEVDAGLGRDPERVSASLTALKPDTVYRYRVVATNEFGTAQANEVIISTYGVPPAATTGPAGALGTSTATLHGSLDPQNSDTSYRFEYGTTTNYGTTTPEADAGSGNSVIDAVAGLFALKPATTYHYRIVATSNGGTTNGADQTFTTAPAPAEGSPPTEGPKPRVCGKGRVKRHGKCVKKPHRHHHGKHKRSHNANSGGSK